MDALKTKQKPVQQNYDHQSTTRLLKTQSNYEEFVIIAHNNTNNTNSPNKTPPTHQPTPE